MNSSFASRCSAPRSFRVRRVLSVCGLALLVQTASQSLLAQADANDDRRRRGGDNNGGRNFDPAEMQARMLSSLRERLEVTDDEEWKVIADRLAKLQELRRNAGGATFGFMGRGGPGGPPGGGGGDASRGRGGRTGGSPEVSALSSAIRDKLPDAEVKARLDRLREVRKENEAKLTKAQEELRAVLSVRQEAVAVMFGLLP